MKTVLIQAALLVAALGVAYQTWTHEEGAADSPGSTRVWEGRPEELSSLTYRSDEVRTVIERREDDAGSYLWATVVHPAAPAPADSLADTPGDTTATTLAQGRPGADSVSFLVGDQGERLAELAASPLAIRDLGIPDDARMQEYELNEPEGRLTIVLGGTERTLEIGGAPWGSSDQYVRDPATGRAYVLDAPLLRMMSNAQMSLPERRLHAFEDDRVEQVTVRTTGGARTMRRATGGDGAATWVLPDQPESPDQTFANFMERVGRLWLQEFAPEKEMGELEHVVRIDYVDSRGNEIGYLDLYREEGEEGPAYFVRTELSRVLAAVLPSIAEQIEQDVNTLF